VVGLYLAVTVLLHVGAVQAFLGSQVSEALGKKLGTTVSVGRVSIGFPSRLIVDDITLQDQRGKTMLRAGRASASVDILPLMKGQISISSAQLFGLTAHLYRQNSLAKPNFQFVIDSLASKDTTKHTPLNLKIGSLIIRRGTISYDQLDQPTTPGKFNTKHQLFENISAHLVIDRLTDDSLDINLKKLSFNEASGLRVNNLRLRADGTIHDVHIRSMSLKMPHSNVHLTADIKSDGKSQDRGKLVFKGSINNAYVTPSDLVCFYGKLKQINTGYKLDSKFSGTDRSLNVGLLDVTNNNGSLQLSANGLAEIGDGKNWSLNLLQLKADDEQLSMLATTLLDNTKLNTLLTRAKLSIDKATLAAHGAGDSFSAQGELSTNVGEANVAAEKRRDKAKATIEAKQVQLGLITGIEELGSITARMDIDGTMRSGPLPDATLKGTIDNIGIKCYDYQKIDIDATMHSGILTGNIHIADQNVRAEVNGTCDMNSLQRDKSNGDYELNAHVSHLNLSCLGLLAEKNSYDLDDITLSIAQHKSATTPNKLDIHAPFIDATLSGTFDYATLPQSFVSLVKSKLPTLPGLPASINHTRNDFELHATLYDATWMNQLMGLRLTTNKPVTVHAAVADSPHHADITINAPHFAYDDKVFTNGRFILSSPDETLYADASLTTDGNTSIEANISASNNQLHSIIDFDNHSTTERMAGAVKATVQFYRQDGQDAAHIQLANSDIQIGDSTWTIQPASIVYYKNHLAVDNFAFTHGDQHLIVNGQATKSAADRLSIDIHKLNVPYILDLVNFTAVSFDGYASGKAELSSVFDNPQGSATIDVEQFKLEDGRLGTLHANATWNPIDKQINIDAVANDGTDRQTLVGGYISIARNYIDLDIHANNTRAEFVETFCSSFMDDVDISLDGNIHLVGDLSHDINVLGKMYANGAFTLTPLGVRYYLKDAQVLGLNHDIAFEGDTIRDKYGHTALVNGHLRHTNLTRLHYDFDVKADNLLAYDTDGSDGTTYYGTCFATGDCSIKGKPGEIDIDVNVTPEKNTLFTYDVAGEDAIISDDNFIHWHDKASAETKQHAGSTLTARSAQSNNTPDANTSPAAPPLPENLQPLADMESDMHINFLVNTNPDATFKLIMDNQSGDYITLNGDGVIRASYYNKGAFNLYGNYNIDHGTYKLTIQNAIKKDFTFQPGGVIAFGGNAFDATLNMKALYTVNGVSLSDLDLGQSFTTNTIRVNCLMNITGTPAEPQVDFTLEMPTVDSEAQRMILSLMNSEEEVAQQVLYLLAVGRFYNQGNNNAGADGTAQYSQTSLAMQSLLSGTLSQQINDVLSQMIDNNKWNFGANISTGTEGWNNAEYEGILSGRMLNDRLIFNGQFGYRDKAYSTSNSNFIGDFDLRYLLTPNGSISINMYNKTNDRYFTRNSLNTQGLGLIMKKDFSSLRDLFGIKRKH